MKSYTDIEQSKKLAEILPIESADMRFEYILPRKSDKMLHYPIVGNPIEALEMFNKGYTISGSKPLSLNEYCIPCWSLAALISILPDSIYDNTDEYSQLEFSKKSVAYHDLNDGIKIGSLKDNLIDACVAMIDKLHEQKLL